MANTSSPSRKILVAHYLPNIISGAENSIADLVDRIDKRFDFTMLVPREGGLASFYRKRGLNVWVKKVSIPRRMFPGLHTVQSWFLALQLKRKGYDAVLCNTFPAASRVGTACLAANIPYAIYMRDHISDSPLHRRVLQQADAVFAISRDVQAHLDGMVEPGSVHLAYNYIHPDPILDRAEAHAASGQRRLPFPPSHPVVGLVGRITPYKRPDLFLRAVPHILAEVPEARFVLVGTAQERQKEFEGRVHAMAKDLGVQEQVAFMGQRRDIIELTSELTVSCLASGREPLGRVILEANLLNIPVVVPDTGGPAEIVENEETGLYFPTQAADAHLQLARQVVRLLKDPDLRECLASNAFIRIFNTFASLRHVQLQENLIERLSNNSL